MPILFVEDFKKELRKENVDLERAKYGERKLDEAFAALTQLSNNAAFEVQGQAQFANLRACTLFTANPPRLTATHNVIAKALQGKSLFQLLAKLAVMFDDHKKEGARGVIRKYIAACHMAGTVYADDGAAAAAANPQININNLYAHNCLARHALNTITTNFTTFITQLCQRVLADWEDINRLFFPDHILVSLARIQLFDSDPHKGGKRVCCLHFEVFPAHPGLPPPQPGAIRRFFARGGGQQHNLLDSGELPRVKLIYKPFDLEFDYRVVAKTATIIARLGAGNLPNNPQTDSLLERLDHNLPTYLILPRNFGSGLAANGNGDIPGIRDSYGYIEFLTHEPNRDGASGAAKPLRNARGGVKRWSDCQPEELDWITTDPNDVTNYYKTMGWYMAIGMVFSFMDGHQGNVIVHKKKPHLIDLEIAFKSPCNDVFSTMYGNALTSHNDAEQSEMYNHLYYLRGSGEPQHSWFLRNNGKFQTGNGARQDKWFQDVKDGFNEALTEMRQPATLVKIQQWIGGNGMRDTVTRITVEATANYYSKLSGICSQHLLEVPPANYTYAGLPAWCQAWIDGKVGSVETTGLTGWIAQSTAPDDVKRPIWISYFPEHNIKDLLNWDIPAYYRRVSTRKLLNSRGLVVAIPQWDLNWDINNPIGEWWWNGISANFGADKAKMKQLLQLPICSDFSPVVPLTFVNTQINDLSNPLRTPLYQAQADWIMSLKDQGDLLNCNPG